MAVAILALLGPCDAEETLYEATVVGGGKIILTFKSDDKLHKSITSQVKITLDNKPAKLNDLKEGFPVKVAWNDRFVSTKIEAKPKQ